MKIRVSKGLSLNIEGGIATGTKTTTYGARRCAVVPDDYPGFQPKAAVRQGDTVAAGAPLLYDKKHPEVIIASPLAGTVAAVARGERRKILYVEVVADGTDNAVALNAPTTAEEARAFLAGSGALALMRQRPFDIVPTPADTVRDIFVTALDTAPLALSPAAIAAELYTVEDIKAGVKVLSLITKGDVYICHGADWTFGDIDGARMVTVEGNHPAGNVGVQIANIAPVNKGETVWTLDAVTLGRIGRMAATGRYNAETIVAVVGPEVAEPKKVKTIIGAPVADILDGDIKADGRNHRIISGNVLTGVAVDAKEGFLEYPYRQITVIAEGDDVNEFMGWASFAPSKMSQNRTFPGHFLSRAFSPDARILGGRRAMILSGQYDKYIPMDIIPEYLLKAIISKNIEDMEALGIYEVAPEDFAAAEYVDASKLPLQQMVRDGIDYLRTEI